MAMTNMGTFSTVNGVREYTTANNLVGTCSATDETFLLRTNSAAIRASTSGTSVDFLRCHIHIEDVTPVQWFAIQQAPLSYNADNGNRGVTDRFLNFEDSSIIFYLTSIRGLFISNCINSRIVNKDLNSTLLLYTQSGASLSRMQLNGCGWELNGQPATADNIRIENTGEGPVNFFVPRIDLSYITLVNVQRSCRMGTASGGNVKLFMWNRLALDNTTVNHQAAANEYNDGITSSWKFRDRDLGTDVEDVLLIVSDDRDTASTIIEKGRYTTNSSGVLTGTYDSQFRTTGANQVRDTVYIHENYTDTSGSTITPPVGLSYDLINVTTRIEIRSYLHEAPSGYIVGDDYALTTFQGQLAPDGTVETYQIFTLNNDLNITETNTATVLAYTDFGTTDKLHDRAKLEWRNNDNYALISKVGSQLDLSAINLTIDATAGSVYSANTTSITAKAATYTGGATSTTGDVTTLNGALLSGGTFDCDVNYQSGAGTTITGITCTGTVDFDTAGTYTINGGTINEVTNSSGGSITLLLDNGATVTTNTGPSITLIQNVDVINTNLLNNTRVQLYNVTKAAELDNSVVIGGGGYSFTVNLLSASVDIGDTLRIRAVQIDGATAQAEYEESGVITASGLAFIGSQSAEPSYNTWALDGSTITKFTADYVNDEVDISVGVNFQLSELGAWWQYNLTTANGIRDFFGGMSFVDEANILIHNSIVNIFLDNITGTNVHQTDNRRLYSCLLYTSPSPRD